MRGVMGKVSRPVGLYIAAVVIVAVALIAPLHFENQDMRWWIELGVLQLLFLVCDSTPTPLVSRQSAWSPSSSATLAAVVLLGPAGAALVGAISVFSLRRHLIVAERLFNGAMNAVSGYAAGRAYLGLSGPIGTPLPHEFPGIIWPFAAVLVLVPLFVARWAMGQFAEQQRAYAATMEALCQAVETKDFYTRGHSERVSRGSGMIAREIGMRPDRADAISYAGMLHDVGKLGVPTKVLQKDGPLTEEEFAAIQLHPMRGLEIVRQIGFLNEALTGIMHHHERMDGRGYPMGFAGAEIPEFARIIAVADAFDSMTSNRSYRQARGIAEAVTELRKGSGSQFDPALVEAFIAVLNREGWRLPEPAAAPLDHQTVTAQDHDDPTAPLRVIESL